uniref:Selenoprotein O n=1 Tax=Pyxicephalus adspersus TaxID=30357 RepID=A0AAV3B6R9_PYXAD|nr:TPA: hypothetical protein GDO54_007143 [Pyxicephalus adspersus]
MDALLSGAVVVMKRAVHSSASPASSLRSLRFDNRALRCLPVEPGDGQDDDAVRSRQVPGACFSPVRPTPVENPKVVALSQPGLALLGVQLGEDEEEEAARYFSGNRLLPGSRPAAHCYCGHQFGNFAGQLGDGAAMYLGEVLNPAGERWEIQLKGAGLTPFSREADGRKVLRSSIREFLCSESMYHLGIPTTRAASCVTSDSTVIRDVFYDGNPKKERCTVVLRIAPTFLRFGSFEIFKPVDEMTGRQGPSVGRDDIRIQMLDYAIGTFYPDIQEKYAGNITERNAEFFREKQLSILLMLAQSNPQLFALFGSKANIKKELENIEQYEKLQESSTEDLLNNNRDQWKTWLQKYSARLQKEQEHSEDDEIFRAERVKVMNSNNPAHILRNYIAQNAIEAAENGDFTEVKRVLKILENPYETQEVEEIPELAEEEHLEACASTVSMPTNISRLPYSSKPPLWATELCVT